MTEDLSPIARACKILGGQAEMARLLDVTPPAVYQWCKGSRAVPAERCPVIERETLARGEPVRCEELRPDVAWGVLRMQSADASPPDPRRVDLGPAARGRATDSETVAAGQGG